MSLPGTIVVTGGAGFIGSAMVRHLLATGVCRIVVVDKLTYAANPAFLNEICKLPDCIFVQADIADGAAMSDILDTHRPGAVLHLAAETHVDRSIDEPVAFVGNNIAGTFTLIEACRRYWEQLPDELKSTFRFLHVSTDEVFGSLGSTGRFDEMSPYRPNSPYAASKAASDHLVRAWQATYGLPVIVTYSSNNYGPYQFPEKLIPLMLIKALKGEALPIYGRGDNVRNWIYVEDHVAALALVLTDGRIGEAYCISGGCELTNLELIHKLCDLLDELLPKAPFRPHRQLITHVDDRPGHDKRYALDGGKLTAELGWWPTEDFMTGLRRTVLWYLENGTWWEAILAERYSGERLGDGGT